MIQLEKRNLNKKSQEHRKNGYVPGVLYGPNFENTLVLVKASDLKRVLTGHSGGLIDFSLSGQAGSGIFHEIQKHHLSGQPIHFDLYVPILDKPVTATVPLVFIGEEALERLGLILNKTLTELEIECLPRVLPDQIDVDVGGLTKAHQSLYLKDLNLTKAIKILTSAETPVATVLPISEIESSQ
ncbi:MAG: 50S ribosomal protein L25 [Patescibacteria group bacterium]|nr:50S ribosomal protein L25 [Patescibacteria group bacterium]MCL5257885.1 50S ribosomal protein L25 [Patescibacteria group bacterium]